MRTEIVGDDLPVAAPSRGRHVVYAIGWNVQGDDVLMRGDGVLVVADVPKRIAEDEHGVDRSSRARCGKSANSPKPAAESDAVATRGDRVEDEDREYENGENRDTHDRHVESLSRLRDTLPHRRVTGRRGGKDTFTYSKQINVQTADERGKQLLSPYAYDQ